MAGFKLGLLGEFSSLLYDEEPKPVKEYLKGIDKAILLKMGSFMLGLDAESSKYNDWRELLSMWFRPTNKEFADKIEHRIIKLEHDSGQKVQILYNIASLKLFEHALESVVVNPLQNEIESEINLFKAYLILTEEVTNLHTEGTKYIKTFSTEIQPALLLFSYSYPTADLTNYHLDEIFKTQIVKAFYLFKFLESDNKFKTLVESFYKLLGLKNWGEYFGSIIPIAISCFKHPSEGWTELVVEKNSKYEKSCSFLDAIALNNYEQDLNPDFKLLRANPIYKVTQGSYRLIYSLFVLEKIFKGLYFKLNEVNSKLPDEERIKNFRQIYTSDFSENFLLYKILRHIYRNKYVQHSGKDLFKAGYEGASDYYIRNGNHLFLFENKDIFIEGSIKQSGDFQLIEKEFIKKLYNADRKCNPKKSSPGVCQLINNIRRVLKYENDFDKSYKSENLIVYPIIILHDNQFYAAGFNYLLNLWFNKELQVLKSEGLAIDKIQPITVITIDTLILYADFLREKKMDLRDLIVGYKKNSVLKRQQFKDEQDLQESYGRTLIPFNNYIDRVTNVGYNKSGKLLMREVTDSFREVYKLA